MGEGSTRPVLLDIYVPATIQTGWVLVVRRRQSNGTTPLLGGYFILTFTQNT